ncbi:MAG: phage tail tape measure protein, partial [Sulfurimonas sp.]
MAVGGSEYSVLLKAVIQKMTQEEINQQTKGLKINLDMNLVGAGQIIDKIDQIKKKASGRIFAGNDLAEAANTMSTMTDNVDKIREHFAGLGQNVSVSKIFDDAKIQKYTVSVDKVVDGVQTINKYSVEIGENGEQIITNAKSVEKSIGDASLKQKKLNDLADGYKLTLDDLKVKHKDAFSTGNKEMTTAENKLLNLIDAFKQGKASTEDIRNAFTSLKTETEKVEQGFNTAREKTDNFSTALVKNIGKVVQWAIATGAIYGTLRDFKEGVQYVKDLNAAMTDVKIVTGMSTIEANKLAASYTELAKEIGSTTLEVAEGNLAWLRQGKTASESAQLLKSSVMMAKLANMDQAESTEALTAIVNGYKLSLSEVNPTISKLISLDNAYATSVSELSGALQKVSAVSGQAKVSLDEMAAMITVGSEDLRAAPETIGQAWKTILMRIQNVKLGKYLSDEGDDISDVEKVLRSLDIELRDDTDSFRDISDVLKDTMSVWNKLGAEGKTVEQSMIATTFAGQRQANVFVDLMNNQDKYNEALKVEGKSLGLLEDRYKTYSDSVEASANRFKASWESVWQKTINSEFIKLFYDAGAGVADLISTLGGLIPIITETAGVLIAFNSVKIASFFTNAIEKAIVFKNALTGVGTVAALTKTQIAGIVIAIAGLVVQVISFIAESNDLNKRLEKSQENISNITTELGELEQKQKTIEDLKNEFSELSKVTSKSEEQQERFNEVQKELKSLLPGLKTEIDAVGDYKITEESLQSNQTYNKLLQERIDLKKEELTLGVKDEIELEAKAYEKNLSKINNLNNDIRKYNELNEKVTSPEGSLTAEEAYDWSHFYIAMDVDAYQSELLELQDKNLEFVQHASETFGTLPPLQQISLLKILGDTENFQKAFLQVWMDTAREAGNKPIVPVGETAKDLQALTEASDNATKSLSSTFNSVVDLIGSLEDSNVATMDQVQTIKDLFPVDATGKLRDYTAALSVQNGQVVVNTNVLRELTVERANAAVAAAQEAYTVANAAFMESDAIISGALAEIKAKTQIINANINLSESDKKLALDAINSANARVIAELAVLEAKKRDVEAAKANLAIAEANLSNISSQAYWNNALAGSIRDVGSAQKETNKALEAYNDLLDMTIK